MNIDQSKYCHCTMSMYDIQENVVTSRDNMILIGDLNSQIPNLDSTFNNTAKGIVYTQNPDNRSNALGKDVVNLCKSFNLYPVNLLSYKDK